MRMHFVQQNYLLTNQEMNLKPFTQGHIVSATRILADERCSRALDLAGRGADIWCPTYSTIQAPPALVPSARATFLSGYSIHDDTIENSIRPIVL